MNETNRKRRLEYLLGTLLSLVIADGLITQFLIKSGIGHEGNPLLKVLVAESNFLVVKMCGAIVCVLILWNLARKIPKSVFIVTSCVVALYTLLIFWNMAVFLIFRP